jgi:hypothetical protein
MGDAVEIEIRGELYSGVAGADHRGDDAFDLIAQAIFERHLALAPSFLIS